MIQHFEYGNQESKEGYWTYEHMMLQLEDVIEVKPGYHNNSKESDI